MKDFLKTYGRRITLFLVILAVFIFLDQWTKALAVRYLSSGRDVVLIKNVLELHYLENSGMAFGLLKNRQVFFYISTAVILAAVFYMLGKTPPEKRFTPLFVTLSFLTAGALGNLIDRVKNRYVVDFIYVSLINFPVFNVADILVSLGSIALVLMLLFVYRDEELKRAYGRKKEEDEGTL